MVIFLADQTVSGQAAEHMCALLSDCRTLSDCVCTTVGLSDTVGHCKKFKISKFFEIFSEILIFLKFPKILGSYKTNVFH